MKKVKGNKKLNFKDKNLDKKKTICKMNQDRNLLCQTNRNQTNMFLTKYQKNKIKCI